MRPLLWAVCLTYVHASVLSYWRKLMEMCTESVTKHIYIYIYIYIYIDRYEIHSRLEGYSQRFLIQTGSSSCLMTTGFEPTYLRENNMIEGSTACVFIMPFALDGS